MSVEVANGAEGVALAIRLKLVDTTSGMLLTPVFYSDNYISLAPGESRQIEINVEHVRNWHGARLSVEGWNIEPAELSTLSA